mgnify:FL=1
MASKINADEFVDREGEGKPTLPKGVVLSGVTTITTAVVAENEVANSTGINAGIITSTHFKGNLTGDVNAGIVTVTSQTVVGSAVTISASGIDIGAGVITATSYAGSGANLTGIGATIMVWEYNPDPYDTAVTFATGIGITFNQKIKAGSGNITLREDSSSGTVVENFGIGSSVTITGNSLTIDPTSDLSESQVYYLELPSGVITNMAGDNYVGTAYTFQSLAYTRTLWTWGINEYGQLGQNQASAQLAAVSSPVQVPATTWRTTAYQSGRQNATVSGTKSDGTYWIWGFNGQGQLGQNQGPAQLARSSSPVQIPGTWSYNHASGLNCQFAVNTDGELFSWGYNNYGRLGHNTSNPGTSYYSSPVQIPGTWSTSAGAICSGTSGVSHFINSDGELFGCGNNNYGQIGNNQNGTPASHSSPVQVPGTTWKYVCGTGWHNTAIKTDGTLWSWGYNKAGQLGLGSQGPGPGATTGLKSSPTQIGSSADWATIGSSGYSAAAIKTDGTLWCWGRNNYGQLGLNENTPTNSGRSSPTQVPGTTWKTVAGNMDFMLAIKTDGTLWGWGSNTEGDLGQNDVVNYSSPTQIGSGTDWGQEIYHLGAIKNGGTAIQQTT